MKVIFSQKFKRDMAVVQPGEYFVSDSHIIHTLLGTCVSVVLYCEEYRIGGLNHYMLPHSSSVKDSSNVNAGRYGVYAMELLINEFLHRGISRSQLVAKVFGGGKVLDTRIKDGSPHVGEQNMTFVLDYLKKESIPILSKDLGGDGGRKIYFFPWTGKVLVSHIKRTQDILEKENLYERRIKKVQDSKRVILFDEEELS